MEKSIEIQQMAGCLHTAALLESGGKHTAERWAQAREIIARTDQPTIKRIALRYLGTKPETTEAEYQERLSQFVAVREQALREKPELFSIHPVADPDDGRKHITPATQIKGATQKIRSLASRLTGQPLTPSDIGFVRSAWTWIKS